jgi:hypothetical protein
MQLAADEFAAAFAPPPISDLDVHSWTLMRTSPSRYFQGDVARARSNQERLALVTAARDEVQVVGAAKTTDAVGHTFRSLDQCWT